MIVNLREGILEEATMNATNMVDKVVKEVYYPGVKFRVMRGRYDGMLEVSLLAKDADQWDKPHSEVRTVGFNTTIPDYLTNEKAAVRFVAECVRRLLDHEFQEWFRYKGERVFNPHPELRQAGCVPANLEDGFKGEDYPGAKSQEGAHEPNGLHP